MKGGPMTHVVSAPATHFSPLRLAIYTRLLSAPATAWTIAGLASTLALRQDSVRSTLYVLLTDGLMTQVPGHRTLTLRLTHDGAQELRSLLNRWRREEPRGKIDWPRVGPQTVSHNGLR
jgi:hypothetical protein